MDPRFLDVEAVIQLHDVVLRSTPGEPVELQSRPALESAVMAPRNQYIYGEVDDLCTLAAFYAYHITMNHAFLAGNKRTAVAACVSFLVVNGCKCGFSGKSLGRQIERMIKGRADISNLADYLRQRTTLPSP